jgi:hypothetical protein
MTPSQLQLPFLILFSNTIGLSTPLLFNLSDTYARIFLFMYTTPPHPTPPLLNLVLGLPGLGNA